MTENFKTLLEIWKIFIFLFKIGVRTGRKKHDYIFPLGNIREVWGDLFQDLSRHAFAKYFYFFLFQKIDIRTENRVESSRISFGKKESEN